MTISIVFIGTFVTLLLGLVLSMTISVVTQMFYVKEDPRIDEIYNMLPHFNCGACGYKGCMPYAKGIIQNCDAINKCRPGGVKVQEKIALFLQENPEN